MSTGPFGAEASSRCSTSVGTWIDDRISRTSIIAFIRVNADTVAGLALARMTRAAHSTNRGSDAADGARRATQSAANCSVPHTSSPDSQVASCSGVEPQG